LRLERQIRANSAAGTVGSVAAEARPKGL
jgi:hypothetical protein